MTDGYGEVCLTHNRMEPCEKCEIAKLRTQIGDLVFDHGKQLAEMTKERDDAKYIPGQFECPKCKFFLISRTLYMQSGTVGPNTKPVECSNGCGPMWRVSWSDSLKEMMKRAENLQDKLAAVEKELGHAEHARGVAEEMVAKYRDALEKTSKERDDWREYAGKLGALLG